MFNLKNVEKMDFKKRRNPTAAKRRCLQRIQHNTQTNNKLCDDSKSILTTEHKYSAFLVFLFVIKEYLFLRLQGLEPRSERVVDLGVR